MDTAPAFEMQLPGYTLRTLQATDIEALQRLCEKCTDYFWQVNGEEVSPKAAEEIFYAGPPGKPLADKFVYGLFDHQGEICAVLEGCRHYPEDATWWIGLLLLSPEARGQRIGRIIVDTFTRYVHQQGGAAIMLGVVEGNKAAHAFWQHMGFMLDSQREPRWFGKKFQSVYVMRRAAA